MNDRKERSPHSPVHSAVGDSSKTLPSAQAVAKIGKVNSPLPKFLIGMQEFVSIVGINARIVSLKLIMQLPFYIGVRKNSSDCQTASHAGQRFW